VASGSSRAARSSSERFARTESAFRRVASFDNLIQRLDDINIPVGPGPVHREGGGAVGQGGGAHEDLAKDVMVQGLLQLDHLRQDLVQQDLLQIGHVRQVPLSNFIRLLFLLSLRNVEILV